MVLVSEITATLQKLDELADTLETGMQSYQQHVGILRGQVQHLAARMHRYADAAGGAAQHDHSTPAKELTFLDKLASKVANRFNNVLVWRKSRDDVGGCLLYTSPSPRDRG